MSKMEISNYAKERGFHPKTLERWLSWEQADRDALAEIAQIFQMGENHLRDIMDWLEEIVLRDRSSVCDVLGCKAIIDIKTDPRLGRADKLKRIKEQLRRSRFPRLAETEDAIRAKIQALMLHPEIRLSVPPGLEEGRLRVEFSATNHEELKRLIAKLTDAKENSIIPAIFDLLSGQMVTQKRS
jgi:hypothetical protein